MSPGSVNRSQSTQNQTVKTNEIIGCTLLAITCLGLAARFVPPMRDRASVITASLIPATLWAASMLIRVQQREGGMVTSIPLPRPSSATQPTRDSYAEVQKRGEKAAEESWRKAQLQALDMAQPRSREEATTWVRERLKLDPSIPATLEKFDFSSEELRQGAYIGLRPESLAQWYMNDTVIRLLAPIESGREALALALEQREDPLPGACSNSIWNALAHCSKEEAPVFWEALQQMNNFQQGIEDQERHVLYSCYTKTGDQRLLRAALRPGEEISDGKIIPIQIPTDYRDAVEWIINYPSVVQGDQALEKLINWYNEAKGGIKRILRGDPPRRLRVRPLLAHYNTALKGKHPQMAAAIASRYTLTDGSLKVKPSDALIVLKSIREHASDPIHVDALALQIAKEYDQWDASDKAKAKEQGLDEIVELIQQNENKLVKGESFQSIKALVNERYPELFAMLPPFDNFNIEGAHAVLKQNQKWKIPELSAFCARIIIGQTPADFLCLYQESLGWPVDGEAMLKPFTNESLSDIVQLPGYAAWFKQHGEGLIERLTVPSGQASLAMASSSNDRATG